MILTALALAACPLSGPWSAMRQMPPGARNVVMIVDSHVYWNSVPIDRATLDQYVEAASMLPPQPLMVLEVAAARDCATQRAVADRIASHGGCPPHHCFISYRPISRREQNMSPPAPSM